MLDKFFKPNKVAVIGASKRHESLGHVLLKNIVEGGFKGNIFPINPRTEPIMGLKTYSSITEVEGEIDPAILIVPASVVIDVVKQCGVKGVKATVVVSAGFSEIGNNDLERDLVEEAKKWGMWIMGPNCAGFIDTYNNLYATIESRIKPGRIAFVTQSGALGGAVLAWAENARWLVPKF